MTLRVYSSIAGAYHACYYYRILVPIRAMSALGLPCQFFLMRSEDHFNPEEEAKRFFGADIIHLYHPLMMGTANQRFDQLKQFRPKKSENGMRWPPSLVVDTDDDLFNVNPLNPAFKDIGTKVDGEPIQPGQAIHFVDGLGQDRVIWQEGQHGFSLASNLQRLSAWRNMLAEADGVVCTTPLCQDYVMENGNPKRTFIQPNSVLLEDYPNYGGVEMVKKHPTEIRIMWQGSDSHHEDLASLRQSMIYLSHRYPQIKWLFFGALFDWVIRELPSDRIEYHKWVDHRAYHIRLGTLAHDINICPLTPHAFNRARSAIKWYESSVLKNPAATIAQKFAVFDQEIEHGKTGMLYETQEQFIECVSTLVENEQKRRELAANAKDWVLENRDAMKTAPALYSFWLELRERKREEMPAPDETNVEASNGSLPTVHAAVQ